jgi:hypothetical protein
MRRLLVAAAMLGLIAAALPAQPRKVAGGGNNVEQTTRVINDCQDRAKHFKKTLDHALAQPDVRAGQGREDQLNNDAERLSKNMDIVGDSWNKDHDIQKTKNHVQAAIANGNDINKAMRNWKMGGDTESDWAALRGELNNLARTFNVPGIR